VVLHGGSWYQSVVVHADQISNIKRILYKTIIGRNYIIQTHLVPTDALVIRPKRKTRLTWPHLQQRLAALQILVLLPLHS